MPFGLSPRYRLRWRFDYLNRPSRYGVWNGNSRLESDSAYYNAKENITFAAIEVEDQLTWDIRRVLDCAGPDFVEFKWRAAKAASIFSEGCSPAHIIALELITRDLRTAVYIDGHIEQSERTAEDKLNLLDQYKF